MSVPGTSFAGELWREHHPLAARILGDPFVRSLGESTLPRASFVFYVKQDAYFLEAFARAYALALARTPDREGMQAFFGLLSGALDELRLHRGYAARWDVDLTETVPAPATLAYTHFLLSTASLQSVGETCAALAPCMRLYAYLGQFLRDAGAAHPGNPYAEWIETYAAPEFEALTRALEALLDRYAAQTAEERAAYRHAMTLERAFFASAYDAGVDAGARE